MAVPYDIIANNNATYNLTINWNTVVGGTPTPVDNTNYTALMQVRAFPNSLTALFTLGTAPAYQGITLGGTNGLITIVVPTSYYLGIGTGTYVYDLVLIDSSGNQYTIIAGTFNIVPGVSQTYSIGSPAPTGGGSATGVDGDFQNLVVEGAFTANELQCNNVAITGGNIDGTTIGAVEPFPITAHTLSIQQSLYINYFTANISAGGNRNILATGYDYRYTNNATNLTLTWPGTLNIDGQVWRITFYGTVTTLTIVPPTGWSTVGVSSTSANTAGAILNVLADIGTQTLYF